MPCCCNDQDGWVVAEPDVSFLGGVLDVKVELQNDGWRGRAGRTDAYLPGPFPTPYTENAVKNKIVLFNPWIPHKAPPRHLPAPHAHSNPAATTQDEKTTEGVAEGAPLRIGHVRYALPEKSHDLHSNSRGDSPMATCRVGPEHCSGPKMSLTVADCLSPFLPMARGPSVLRPALHSLKWIC
jgi:hypothetical protein